jgi:hypothetical protein
LVGNGGELELLRRTMEEIIAEEQEFSSSRNLQKEAGRCSHISSAFTLRYSLSRTIHHICHDVPLAYSKFLGYSRSMSKTLNANVTYLKMARWLEFLQPNEVRSALPAERVENKSSCKT